MKNLPWLLLLAALAGRAATPLYSADSPWNRPIPEDAAVDPDSRFYIAAIEGQFGSRTDRYTFPVYRVDRTTPRRRVRVSGYWSDVRGEGR